jgi:hypothetical protein
MRTVNWGDAPVSTGDRGNLVEPVELQMNEGVAMVMYYSGNSSAIHPANIL